MENPEVAQIFEEVADLLEIQGANPFRVRAYRNAARVIRDLLEPVAELVGPSDHPLESLSGIGKDLAEKIRVILATGELPLLQELRAQLPQGLRDLLRVPGLGPKRAQILYKQLNIGSIAELRTAAEEHRIGAVRGFGAKTEAAILKSLEQVEQTGRRIYLAEAKVFADSVVRWLRTASGLRKIDVGGSFRRRQETIGDLDVLVTCSRTEPVMDRLAAYESTAEVMARGETKMTVRLRSGIQLDLRVVPDKSYGAALMYFTGSKAHNILLRRRAQEAGLKLNEYGLFRGNRTVAGSTEEEVYAALGLPWIPPELREGRGEIEMALAGKLPKLIELQNVRGDLHMHTAMTDGRSSLEEMVQGARQRGYDYIAITDHSKRVTMAKGFDGPRLREQWKTIDKLAGKVKGITILKGIELDILEDGTLDLPDDVLKEADWVVASVHYGQNQPKEQITRRLINAIKHPYISAIAHPSGRLIGQRNKYDMDLEAVMQAAADFGCCLELNAQPSRLDLDDISLPGAKQKHIPIVISSDAHSVEELAFMEFGIYQARRAGLEVQDILNTRGLAQLQKLLKKRR